MSRRPEREEPLVPGRAGDEEAGRQEWASGCCGLLQCSGFWTRWRAPKANRAAWKALCTCAFCLMLAVYLYLIGPYSPIGHFSVALCICGAVFLAKGLIEIWGQDTPNWICPGTCLVFLLIYLLGFPSMFLSCFAYCTQVSDLAFPGRDVVAVALNLLGSAYALGYEMHRFRWKAKPENKGKLHTTGLAAFCIHPNYLGDLFTYTGWALAAGTWCAMSIPLAMIWMLSMLVIPNSDAYLAERYPEEFPAYSGSTATLIPGLHSRKGLLAVGWVGFAVSIWAGNRCSAAQCGA